MPESIQEFSRVVGSAGARANDPLMHKGSFFQHAAVYGLANLLLQGGSFILLPIYLRCLTQADYGVLEVVGRLAETVGAFLLFGGFRQAMLTFYQQADDEPQRRRLVCSALVLYLVSALLGGGLALGVLPDVCRRFAPVLTNLAGGSDSPVMGVGLFRLAILGILLEPFSLVPLTLIQARVESLTYVVVVVAQLVLRVTLCIVLVCCFSWGVAGALAATALTGMLFGLVLSARELTRGIALPSIFHMSGLIRFALPLMPGGLCFFVMNHGDRFFLRHYGSAEEVGIYALGYKIAMTVSIFSLSPLYMVWSARMYSVARLPEAPAVFGRMFTRILAVYVFAGLGVCLFGREVVAVMGGNIYARSSSIIAPVLLGCFFQGSVSLMDAGLYVRHRPVLKLLITLCGTAVMVLFYMLLIPPYGIMGAALATLLGFAFLACFTWIVTQRVFPVQYEYLRLMKMIAFVGGVWMFAQALPPTAWALATKVGLWPLVPLLAWVGGWITLDEKEYLRGLVAKLRATGWPKRTVIGARRLAPRRPRFARRPEGGEDVELAPVTDLSLTPARTQD